MEKEKLLSAYSDEEIVGELIGIVQEINSKGSRQGDVLSLLRAKEEVLRRMRHCRIESLPRPRLNFRMTHGNEPITNERMGGAIEPYCTVHNKWHCNGS